MRLTPRDLCILEAIERHYWLPSHYLYEFTKHIRGDNIFFRQRLKVLVDEGYLERPIALNNPKLVSEFRNYVVAVKGREELRVRGIEALYASPPAGGYAHSAMTIAITANIDLEATKAGFRYITQDEILREAPQKTLSLPTDIKRTFNNKAHHSSIPTVPDQLFGIDYGNDKYRFFAVEADRGTEPLLPTKSFRLNSILRKILSYDYILKKKDYQKLLGIPVLYPLFVTTSPERARHMAELAKEELGHSNLMLFTSVPGFHVYFKTPSLLPQLFTNPWSRAGKPDFYINAP